MFLSLIVLTAVVEEAVPDAGLSRWKDAAGIVQAVFTALAILVGLVIAVVKLELFREFQPHLTISHEVSHRPVGDSYAHIAVTATLYNSSRVLVEVGEAQFHLQQISPALDEEAISLYAQAFSSGDYEDFQWPTLDTVQRIWGEGALAVEPGEAHPEPYEFIVSRDVESVIIYTRFSNTRNSGWSAIPSGWSATTFYDLANHEGCLTSESER